MSNQTSNLIAYLCQLSLSCRITSHYKVPCKAPSNKVQNVVAIFTAKVHLCNTDRRNLIWAAFTNLNLQQGQANTTRSTLAVILNKRPHLHLPIWQCSYFLSRILFLTLNFCRQLTILIRVYQSKDFGKTTWTRRNMLNILINIF